MLKINKTSRCVNHVYTLPPKLSSTIKRFDFLRFSSVASMSIGKGDEYGGEKKNTYTNVGLRVHGPLLFCKLNCTNILSKIN